MEDKSKNNVSIWQKLGFTATILIIGLALHGANDLRKNLHYGSQAYAATLEEKIDSKEVVVNKPGPLFTKENLKKMEIE